MKSIFTFIFLLVLGFSSSTCKKISKFPMDLTGTWSAHHEKCAFISLVISEDGQGIYGGCSNAPLMKGKVRFTDKALYIGVFKLKFISKPEKGNGIEKFDGAIILAKMTVLEPIGYGNNKYKLFKTR